MGGYTEESLDNLKKGTAISILLSLQSRLESVKIETELKVLKQVNSLLQQRALDLERKCWANAQYSQIECTKIGRIAC